MTILITDKVNFRAKKITRDAEGYYVMIIGSIHQENKTILSVCAPSSRAIIYVKHKLKEKIDKWTHSLRI